MKNNVYKCPFCLTSFTKEQAIPKLVNKQITIYQCPNDTVDKTTNRLACNKELPINFFDAESKVISITGGTGVGKTYYLIALLLQLKMNRGFHRLGISGNIIGGKEALQDINKKVDEIANGKTLLFTPAGNEKKSLVIDLLINKGKKNKHVYLSFFDNPGEKFDDITYMYEHFSNIYQADGILFLIDPLQINHLINDIHIENDYLKNQRATDLYKILYNVIELLKHVHRTKIRAKESGTLFNKLISKINIESKKISCPFAIGITKMDLIKHKVMNLPPNDMTDFDIQYLHNNYLNHDLVNSISTELEELIFDEEVGELAVKNLLDVELSNHKFFGIQSGDFDKDNPTALRLNPHGVLLPLLWLLIKLKLY